MNSSSVMVFKTTTNSLLVHTALKKWPPSDALIAFRSPYIVHRALCNTMSTCRYTALRYVHDHVCNPLLITLKIWRDGFYQHTSLLELGLHFYIGHHHTPCPSVQTFQQILVTGLNGAHYVSVQFCACACQTTPGWVEYYRQLLWIGWYPASFDQPRTAFTFDLPNTYRKLTLQGKLNLYDFYLSIMQKTNHCGQKELVCFFITTFSRCLICSSFRTATTTCQDAFASGVI